MFSRYFLTIFVITLFIFVTRVTVSSSDEADVENRGPAAVTTVLKILEKAIAGAAKHCIQEAAETCKQHSKNPKEALRCGEDFIKANKGRCIIGH